MAVCSVCNEDLTIKAIDVDSPSDNIIIVPDDVELECGCHFHWECLCGSYTYDQCPTCLRPFQNSSSSSGETHQVLCTLTNEGGVQRNIDILPHLVEAAHLNTFPEERRARSFLAICEAHREVESDMEMIAGILLDFDSDNGEHEEMGREVDILRYADPLSKHNTPLHVAVLNRNMDMAWLLLYLASQLHQDCFPARVVEAARKHNLHRENGSEGKDIRLLTNDDKITAGNVAKQMGEDWAGWERILLFD
ncbi:MAG: hypothetical protein M1829_004986 [Trizodia sp. TS-e1964]|nr:MAG: hypothetical protein M1829_004986 [Trizodia sp. TS-e1964]